MNPVNQFGPPKEFVDAQNTSQSIFGIFIVLFVLLIIFAVFRSIQTQSNYKEARQDYLENPNDAESRLRLAEAAAARSTERHTGMEAMAIMEATRNPVVINDNPQQNLTAELEALANLHANGHLSDAEFEQAKAKLLS